jgi:hypothetical protein
MSDHQAKQNQAKQNQAKQNQAEQNQAEQNQAKQNQAKQKCEAREYGDCYLHVQEVDVTFKFRNFNGDQQPDKVVKICMCEGHSKWLSLLNQGNPLEMRGEESEYAIHDDLFKPLAEKLQMFTLLKVDFFCDKKEVEFHLFNGRDVGAMRTIINSYYPTEEKFWTYEEGFFQTTFQYNEEHTECVVVEVKNITDELALEALANGLTHVNMMTPESKCVNIGKRAFTLVPRTETDPLYVEEPMPELFKRFFKEKKEAHQYEKFLECISFIESEIDRSIINWDEVREKSLYTEKELFEKSQQLSDALLQSNESSNSMVNDILLAGDIKPDVLWVTYITANHQLFASSDPKKDLTKNKQLVDLFVLLGLEKNLLALAITGERERYLFVKMRAHYNILKENEFVVEYLVPRVISSTEIIYKSEHDEFMPLGYWKYYDNTTNNHTGWGGQFSTETFEKNEKIHLYLEKNMPPGKLDVNVLSAEVLPIYKKFKANGHHDAEFVILGYPSLFEYRPLDSSNNFKQLTVEEGEKIMTGICARFEEKKLKLQANDYVEWENMNKMLLKHKYE